jgi:hypothetical protein
MTLHASSQDSVVGWPYMSMAVHPVPPRSTPERPATSRSADEHRAPAIRRAHQARRDQRCHRCRAPPKAQLRVRRFSGLDPRYGSGGRTGALARLIRQRDQPSSRTADFERELSGQDDVDHVRKVRAGLGHSNSHIRPFTGTPGSHPGVGFRERRAIGGSFLPLLPVSGLF